MPWTDQDIERTRDLLQVAHVEDRRKQLSAYEADTRQDQRRSRGECRACFYLGAKIAGQGFTAYTCRNCERQNEHPNTAVPRLCRTCADERNLCVHCGGPRETYVPPAVEARTDTVAEQLLGIMAAHPEWRTTSHLAVMVAEDPRRVYRQLSALEARGLVRSRALHGNRREWRVVGEAMLRGGRT